MPTPDPNAPAVDTLHVPLPQTPPLPATSSSLDPPAAPPAARRTVIPSFLHLRHDLDNPYTHPEEGRVRVILHRVESALTPWRSAPATVTPEQRARLEKEVAEHLTRQLVDAFLDPDDENFLKLSARRLVAAVLDGSYVALLGGGGPLGLIRQRILEKQELGDAVLLRLWGIGDLTADGVESVPGGLRGTKAAVNRGSILFAEGLLAAAHRVEQLDDAAHPPLALAQRIAAARLTAYLLESGLTNAPLLFDLDRLQRLTTSPDTSAQGHLAALRALWPVVSDVRELGLIGVPTFLSRSARGDADWAPSPMRRLSTEDTRPFVQLIGLAPIGDPSPAPAPAATAVPLPLLRALMPLVGQLLDRRTGEVSLRSTTGPVLTVRVPATAANATPEELRAQDGQLARVDALITVLFGDVTPLDPETLPRLIELTDDRLRIGQMSMAIRRPDGTWRLDPDGVALARDIYSEDGVAAPKNDPLPDWAIESKSRGKPGDTAAGARRSVLRVYLQMENDPVIMDLGLSQSRAHPDDLVWVQVREGGEYRVVRGQSLLDNADADVSVKLLVSGHGHTSRVTGERLLSGRAPRSLADELTRLMPRLLPRSGNRPVLSRISLLSCALETPVAQRSYGRTFAQAAGPLGLPGMETTVYAQTLWVDMHRRHHRKNTQLHSEAPIRRGAAGTTWLYRVDPVTGVVSVRDRYPNGSEGLVADGPCCAILGVPTLVEASHRSMELAAVDIIERGWMRDRFHDVVQALRPAGMHLVPRLALLEGGRARMTFMDLDSGALQTREVIAAADVAILRAGMAFIDRGLSEVGGLGIDMPLSTAHLDLLNTGLLALMLSDLAGDTPRGDAYQEALWYLGIEQGGFQAGAEVAAMASVIRQTASRSDAASMAVLVERTSQLSQALATVSRLAQAGSIGVDVARLIDAIGMGDRARITPAAVQVGLDAAGLALVGLSVAADLAGATVIAALAEGLAVPLAGLSLGIAALTRSVWGEAARLNHNAEPLRQINRGYEEPLRRMALATGADPKQPGPQALMVNGWAPIRRIDFVAQEVTFANADVGASSLHRHQLYWQAGSRRLHDWWISDGADKQHPYARHGLDMDLWSLMHSPDRMTQPKVRIPIPLRDPDLVLGLMTAPNLAIHFGQYSSSRAGGDFALLGDPLIERMQENSDANFVGDYVSSTSFAKSADEWRYEQKPTLFEVVLDEQSRTLALPERSEAESATWEFKDGRSVAERTYRPLDQSQVQVRLIGGGGRTTIALPADGTVRHPVRILPSSRGREIWTLRLKGGLLNGGQPIAFTDGGVAGVRIAGQEFQFEALHGAVVQLADPLVPDVRLVLDLARRSGSLVLTLPPWSESLRPNEVLAAALRLLAPPDGTSVQGRDLFLRPDDLLPQGPVQVSSILPSGELMSGVFDPVHGGTLLSGAHHLLLGGLREDGSTGWQRYALNGGELSLEEDHRPVVRYDGGRHFGPVTFTYRAEERRFERGRLALTVAGEQAITQWMLDHPGWTWDQLSAFMTTELAADIELAGPEGGQAAPIGTVDFYYMNADSLRPTQGLTALALWQRLDRLEAASLKADPKATSISLDADTGLARALVRLGFAAFQAYAGPPDGKTIRAPATQVPVDVVARAKQWLILRHAQDTGAYGTWSDLHAPTTPLNVNEYGTLSGLRARLKALLDGHQATHAGSDWIKLGDTPEASSELAHRLRDAGVNILLDHFGAESTLRQTNRAGPDDFYDVLVTTLRLFLHDLDERLEGNAAAFRELSRVKPPGLSDTPLEGMLTQLAAARELGRKHGETVQQVSLRTLEQVRRAGLTFWRPDGGAEEARGELTLGRVVLTDKGGAIEDATLRLWRAQASTQGLLLDGWYARHAVPGTPLEQDLREAAALALRDRLIRLRAEAARTGEAALALDEDPTFNRQLFEALQRLLPATVSIRQVGNDSAHPGDVVHFLDTAGDGHYALMRRPDTDLVHLPRDPAALRGGQDYWSYLGSAKDLDKQLKPRITPVGDGPPKLDPAAYHAWRYNDPSPVIGEAYLYDNPRTNRQELFQLLRLHPQFPKGAQPYDFFPTDGSSSPAWRYLGNTESLSADELGALAHSPTSLKAQTFSVGLLEWWTEQLAPQGNRYRNFRIEDNGFSGTTWGGSVFRVNAGNSLHLTLDDNDATTFRLGSDPEFQALCRRFLTGKALPRWLLIQGNGRPVDLDGAAALGIPEIVILEEIDGAPRRIDMDDVAGPGTEVFYEGRDLLIHRTSNGQLIRIRNALRADTPLFLDDEWTTDVAVTARSGQQRLQWPDTDRTLRLPMLTLHGTALKAVQEDLDLRIGDAGQWSRMRVPDVYALVDRTIGDQPTGDDEALVRYQAKAGTWRIARLSAPLVAAMGTGAGSPVDWTLNPGTNGSAATLTRDSPAGVDGAPGQRWALAQAKLSEAMASSLPAGRIDLAPRWGPGDTTLSSAPLIAPLTGSTTSSRTGSGLPAPH